MVGVWVCVSSCMVECVGVCVWFYGFVLVTVRTMNEVGIVCGKYICECVLCVIVWNGVDGKRGVLWVGG